MIVPMQFRLNAPLQDLVYQFFCFSVNSFLNFFSLDRFDEHFSVDKTGSLKNDQRSCFNQEVWLMKSSTVVPLMKPKDKLQQELIARNCWRTDAALKLPQRESPAEIRM